MKRLLYKFIAAYVAAASCAFGATAPFEVTVAAGPYERTNVPVRVPMPQAHIGNEPILSAMLEFPDRGLIRAQWTGPSLTSTAAGEVHFILPHLRAGESLRLSGAL